jgi:hypothetical protein
MKFSLRVIPFALFACVAWPKVAAGQTAAYSAGQMLSYPAVFGPFAESQVDAAGIFNVRAFGAKGISGIPGHDIEDIRLSDIRIYTQGGGTREQAALVPPEKYSDDPEPVMFGEMPASQAFDEFRLPYCISAL